ncbi:hypothetical protein CDD81_1072 [Ophiocordyceps australis]|uniref:Luciferase domain-containing protein n=1 Tax=Ophiocordyceps australis TaxID=1399860 RepID=A0A2C5XWP2_9HYPO|nr:hypothetical protein CDD81_1072 [Ophiocordyceps australis]
MASDFSFARLRDLPHPIQKLMTAFAEHRLLATSALGIVPLLAIIFNDYRGFVALGPGGLPSNPLGWLAQLCLQPLGRLNTLSTSSLHSSRNADAVGPRGRDSFLGAQPLPPRRGHRPKVPGYVAPQRQTSECAVGDAVARMNAYVAGLACRNPEALIIKGSGLESKHCKALWLEDRRHPLPDYLAATTHGEIVHVHAEGSSHAVLSLIDAQIAIEQGWAQLHKLSGRAGMLPLTYVLIYAPRDQDETEVWQRLVTASALFNTAHSGGSLRLML